MIIYLKDMPFVTREDLDSAIQRTFGTDVEKNKEHSIEGFASELGKLSLGPLVTVFGVSITSIPDPIDETKIKTKKGKGKTSRR